MHVCTINGRGCRIYTNDANIPSCDKHLIITKILCIQGPLAYFEGRLGESNINLFCKESEALIIRLSNLAFTVILSYQYVIQIYESLRIKKLVNVSNVMYHDDTLCFEGHTWIIVCSIPEVHALL